MKKKILFIGLLNLFFLFGFSQDGNKKAELKNGSSTTTENKNGEKSKIKKTEKKMAESKKDETKETSQTPKLKEPELLEMKKNE